jgi:hypothetical protein
VDPIDRAAAYLSMPPGYVWGLGGLTWSDRRDAIERDGVTFAMCDELTLILEGVFSRSPTPPFAYVLGLLDAMKRGGGRLDPLHRAYQATAGVPARGRNAGLLIAELCCDLPSDEKPVEWADLRLALQSLQRYGEHHYPMLAIEPALPLDELLSRVAKSIENLDEAALVHWFTYGVAPGAGGEQLAKQTETLSSRLARTIELARRTERLVGAVALTPALEAAIAIPPRRRSADSLPQGGYCDVAASGDLAQILPHQLVLDPDEFVRRFAGKELLFFKREEPHQSQRPERIIVLDLGIRTWGTVRLALAAATFSLLKQDSENFGVVRLFTTARSQPVDLLATEPSTLIELLESSDFSRCPDDCLRSAFVSADDKPALRDIVLLTHPRSLNEPTVARAADRRLLGDRLFAATVADDGRAEFSLWSTAGLVPLKRFRIDLQAAEQARVEASPAAPSSLEAPAIWVGDVEPVAFPFRPGLLGEPQELGFDADGEWLVAASRDGILHALSLDGGAPEILPRAYIHGRVLKQVSAILGVSGGVAVCGRMVLPAQLASADAKTSITLDSLSPLDTAATAPSLTTVLEYFVAAHYERASRRLTLHVLGPSSITAYWAAFPDLHCITVRSDVSDLLTSCCALDLKTGARWPAPQRTSSAHRAAFAWSRSLKSCGDPLKLAVNQPSAFGSLHHQADTVRLVCGGKDRVVETPREEGKPILAKAVIQRAELAGNVLAVAFLRSGERKLLLLNHSNGAVLGQVRHPTRQAFTLSRDGRRLGRVYGTSSLAIANAAAPATTLVSASRARLHNWLDVRLSIDPFRLIVGIGTFAHSFHLFEGRLRYSLVHGWDKDPTPKGPFANSPVTHYDPARFPGPGSTGEKSWTAVMDRLGQVLLFRKNELVIAFLIRRERAAAYLPGGVFWGDASLIGSPPTPDADLKIGQALMRALVHFNGE